MPAARQLLAAAALGLAAIASSAGAQADPAARLDAAIAGGHRSEANRARDTHRHPRETLLFFGLRPDMHVVEVWPGGGWYTEILAPALRGTGRYYAAQYARQHPDTSAYRLKTMEGYETRLRAQPAVYGEVVLTELSAPQFTAMAPAGSADLVLTFRNVHNWAKAGNADAMFAAFFAALKPGGVLGVVEHRARPGASLATMIESGYMTEAWVIEAAQKAGFRLHARAEINANPRDTTDHPRGVWSLPPGYAAGDRERFAAIGESDRMTLRFLKP
jgi:predicted methyltransferase